MGRWNRDRLSMTVGLVLVGGVVSLVWIFRLPPAEQSNGIGVVTVVLSFVSVVITLVAAGARASLR